MSADCGGWEGCGIRNVLGVVRGRVVRGKVCGILNVLASVCGMYGSARGGVVRGRVVRGRVCGDWKDCGEANVLASVCGVARHSK